MVAAESDAAVDAFRERHDRARAIGIPPHVTILYPFVPADRLDDAVVASLRALYAGTPAFGFALAGVRTFPNAVWLAPQPAEPFLALVESTAARFPAHPPYGGAFAETIPHLTVGDDPAAAAEARRAIPLPISCRAAAVTLLVEGADGRWREAERLPLRPT